MGSAAERDPRIDPEGVGRGPHRITLNEAAGSASHTNMEFQSGREDVPSWGGWEQEKRGRSRTRQSIQPFERNLESGPGEVPPARPRGRSLPRPSQRRAEVQECNVPQITPAAERLRSTGTLSNRARIWRAPLMSRLRLVHHVGLAHPDHETLNTVASQPPQQVSGRSRLIRAADDDTVQQWTLVPLHMNPGQSVFGRHPVPEPGCIIHQG